MRRHHDQKFQIRPGDQVLHPLDINMLILQYRTRWNQIARSDGSVQERPLVDIKTRSSSRLSDTAQSQAVSNPRCGLRHHGRTWMEKMCALTTMICNFTRLALSSRHCTHILSTLAQPARRTDRGCFALDIIDQTDLQRMYVLMWICCI